MTWVWIGLAAWCALLVGGIKFGPRDDWGYFGPVYMLSMILLGITLLTTVISVVSISFAKTDCRQQGRNYGVAVRYEIPSGCYLKLGDQYVPSDQYITNHQK